jgi:hypothetical protein
MLITEKHQKTKTSWELTEQPQLLKNRNHRCCNFTIQKELFWFGSLTAIQIMAVILEKETELTWPTELYME